MVEKDRIEVAGQAVDVLVDSSPWDGKRPQLWPSVGMYPCYDELLYDFMSMDEVRNEAYRDALELVVPGRSVLDIGTGRDLNWALESVGFGADSVTAVEGMPETYELAAEQAAENGWLDDITLLRGWSSEISLPRPVEVCVSEIIGDIGGAEGAAAILADARRRLTTPDAVFVPHRCVTYAAATCFADIFPGGAGFFAESLNLLGQAFRVHGGPFDVLLGVANVGPEALVSDHAPVEDLEFNGDLRTEGEGSATLTVARRGRVDGLLLWIRLWCLPDRAPIDSLTMRTNWMPVYLPLFDEPHPVDVGDTLRLAVRHKPGDDGVHPDYSVAASLRTAHGPAFGEFRTEYRPTAFRGRPIYQQLFPVS
ncbi:class I SAM-dependent methyltransferase [Amycolatopsis anabasis]|uniref:class I SAM-dependent methyltransferase n=1 Tax=Amycolatopsis anabasis TaxID=1840409 RepID=UPI00131A8502|nr:class I SAM-dependent methyltransferase [Amycolatopsis anabasis]